MDMQKARSGTLHLYIDGGHVIIEHGKVERGDVYGNGHTDIIWIDGG